MKPKIPCWPGFWPVIIEDHATEEISGIDESIFLNTDCEINRLVFGIMPVSAKCFNMPKGTPSRPIITVFESLFIDITLRL